MARAHGAADLAVTKMANVMDWLRCFLVLAVRFLVSEALLLAAGPPPSGSRLLVTCAPVPLRVEIWRCFRALRRLHLALPGDFCQYFGHDFLVLLAHQANLHSSDTGDCFSHNTPWQLWCLVAIAHLLAVLCATLRGPFLKACDQLLAFAIVACSQTLRLAGTHQAQSCAS